MRYPIVRQPRENGKTKKRWHLAAEKGDQRKAVVSSKLFQRNRRGGKGGRKSVVQKRARKAQQGFDTRRLCSRGII